MKYNPALDGLRALACLVVVGIHANVPGFAGGYLGVDVFFVLSGYLITRVLMTSRPTLGQFYLRRAKRLYPALLFMLGGVLLLQTVLGLPVLGRDALLSALYLTDYIRLPGSWFEHSWSLSAEEHFYLLWPVALLWRPSWRVMVGVTFALLAWRIGWEQVAGWNGVYSRFDTHATGLAAGCALALHPNPKLPAWCGWLGAALLVAALWLFPIAHRNLWGIPLAEVATVLMIAGNWRAPERLAFIGKLSYGWYLWHFPLMFLAHALDPAMSWLGVAAFSGLGGLLMAALSYFTVEAWARSEHRVFEVAAPVDRQIGSV